MSHRIYTRQIKLPKSNRPLTAKDIKGAVQRRLEAGEELIQLALIAVEPDGILVEVGLQKKE